MKNAITYAFLGDAIYEFYIREYLISKGYNKSKDLQNNAVKYVSAKNQRRLLECLVNDKYLTEEELEIVKYGRNSKGNPSKACDTMTYRYATGLECLLGRLYYDGKLKRIEEIMKKVVSY